MPTPTDTAALTNLLLLIRSRMSQIRPDTQDAIAMRRRIVDPVLDALGWSVEDANRVTFAVDIAGQTLDYVLKLQGSPLIGVTADRGATAADVARHQAVRRAMATAGIPWHLLVTGHRWEVTSVTDEQSILDVRLDAPGDSGATRAAEGMQHLDRDAVIRGSLTRLLRERTEPGTTLPSVLPASPIPAGKPAAVRSSVRRRGIPQALAFELTDEEDAWLTDVPHDVKVLYHAWRQAVHRANPSGLRMRVHAHHVAARVGGRIVATAAIDGETIVTWLPVSTDWIGRLDGAVSAAGKRHPGSGDVEVHCATLSDIARLDGPLRETTRQKRQAL